jgi:hypothetical protein
MYFHTYVYEYVCPQQSTVKGPFRINYFLRGGRKGGEGGGSFRHFKGRKVLNFSPLSRSHGFHLNLIQGKCISSSKGTHSRNMITLDDNIKIKNFVGLSSIN